MMTASNREKDYLSKRSKLKRLPFKGAYDKESIWPVLKNNWMCQIAFNYDETPFCLPTIYFFDERKEKIYIHGAAKSRMLKAVCSGDIICISIYKMNQLVLGRSGLHHSINFDSVVIFGKGKEVCEYNEKVRILKLITDNVIPGRSEELREPLKNEILRTGVIEISFEEASYKGRSGDPADEDFDLQEDTWAGLVNISEIYSNPQAAASLKKGISLSKSVENITKENEAF